MAKDKERSINPAAAARKAEKDRARKKGKAAVAAQRTERLARQNPSRVERQIADLKELEQSTGQLNARDRKALEELERDLVRIRKAKETTASNQGSGSGVKRRWEERGGGGDRSNARPQRQGRTREESSGEETDESVRRIPMPRDTPPPVPHRRRGGGPRQGQQRRPEGEEDKGGEGGSGAAAVPVVESKTVYEAKPIIKDLRKEAASFVPSAVRKKIDQTKGTGGKLLEAEEMDALEAQGYVPGGNQTGQGQGESTEVPSRPAHAQVEEVPDEDM